MHGPGLNALMQQALMAQLGLGTYTTIATGDGRVMPVLLGPGGSIVQVGPAGTQAQAQVQLTAAQLLQMQTLQAQQAVMEQQMNAYRRASLASTADSQGSVSDTDGDDGGKLSGSSAVVAAAAAAGSGAVVAGAAPASGEAADAQQAPCTHNTWTRREEERARRVKKKRPLVLHCLTCGVAWKTKLRLHKKCPDFFNGTCAQGERCPYPHIYSRKIFTGAGAGGGGGAGGAPAESAETSSKDDLSCPDSAVHDDEDEGCMLPPLGTPVEAALSLPASFAAPLCKTR